MDSISRATGCLLGLAIGDAMGMPTSFLPIAAIRERFGQIVDFQDPPPGHPYHDGLRRAEITDDTEQSLALAKSFLRCGQVDVRDIVQELLEWARRVDRKYVSPFGPSTRRALELIRQGLPAEEAGREGDTNGAAMRIAPLGILHGARGSPLAEVLQDTALVCLPTHGTQVAIAAAAAVAWAIARCFPEPASPLEVLAGAGQAAQAAERLGRVTVAPSIHRRIEWIRREARRERDPEKSLADLYELFGGGVAAADSIPVALGLFVFCQGDPWRTALTAANMGGDSDTIGAIATAIAGAYSGCDAIPRGWAEKIQQVNALDLPAVAQALVDLAPRWRITGYPLDVHPGSGGKV